MRAVVLGLACVVVLRSLVFSPNVASSDAMADTILKGDYFLALKAEFAPRIPLTSLRLPRVRDVRPGDIVLLRRPDDRERGALKRCVARAGQTVEIRQGRLHVDGALQDEPHVRSDSASGSDFGPYVVPPGQVFLLGDHRDASHDSRAWGAVPEAEIEGRALFVYWSWDRERGQPRLDRIGRVPE